MFIVLEGADGSGKATQLKLIVARLKAVGHEVEIFDFPQYREPSSVFVTNYLKGKYGPASEVSPYTASLFYALDRYQAAPKIRAALKEGRVVVANRYVGSNMAHQGSKFHNLAQQRGFFIWDDSLEYEMLGIPRPDINIYLRVPVAVSLGLIDDRSKQTRQKKDQHEADSRHLERAVATYDLLCKLFPKDFVEIDCAPSGILLPIVQVNDQIWNILKPLLPEPKHRPKATVLKLDSISALKSKKAPKTSQDPLSVKTILTNKAERIPVEKFSGRPLKLTSALPRNEMDLLVKKIKQADLDSWSFRRKQEVLLREIPKLLPEARYELETDKPGQLLTLNAQQLLNAKTTDSRLFESVVAMVSEVHPLVAQHLKKRLPNTQAKDHTKDTNKA